MSLSQGHHKDCPVFSMVRLHFLKLHCSWAKKSTAWFHTFFTAFSLRDFGYQSCLSHIHTFEFEKNVHLNKHNSITLCLFIYVEGREIDWNCTFSNRDISWNYVWWGTLNYQCDETMKCAINQANIEVDERMDRHERWNSKVDNLDLCNRLKM